jgi:Rab family, other
VGNGEEQNGLQMMGLNLMGKTLAVRGARVAYSIWDVAGNSRTTDGKYNLFSSLASSLMGFFFLACVMEAGDSQFVDHIPIACKDAVAILYMFDLTSRCTLNK